MNTPNPRYRTSRWQQVLMAFLGHQPAHVQNRLWLVMLLWFGLWLFFVAIERHMPMLPVLAAAKERWLVRFSTQPVLRDLWDLGLQLLWLFFSPYVLRHLLVIGLASQAVLMVGAAYLRDLFELPANAAIYRHLLALLFGGSAGKLHVQQGGVPEADQNHPIYRVGGPGVVEVQLGNAALFERLDGSVHIAEAGEHTLNGYERLRAVLDLRYQHLRLDKVVALSRDGVAVSIEDVQVRYRLLGNMAMTPANPFPLSEKAALLAVYQPAVLANSTQTWQDTVCQFVQNKLRAHLNAYPLDTHLIAHPGQGLRHSLATLFMQPETQQALQQIGVSIEWVGVGTIRTEQVSEQQIERHKMAWLQQLKEQPNWQHQVYADALAQTRQQWVQQITKWFYKELLPPSPQALAKTLHTQIATLQKQAAVLSPTQQAQFADLLAALQPDEPKPTPPKASQ